MSSSSAAARGELPAFATRAAAVLIAAKLAIHAASSLFRYGYFRDELYFLDLARHLDWGYVDTAPLIAVYAKLALLLGGSLPALRILPVLAGAALIALTMLIAHELGGGRFAQAFAGVCVLLGPAFLAVDNILSMNAFEPLFWMGAVLVVARILRTGDSRLWPGFGVLAGLGLENKHSTLFFGFAVVVALLLTGYRREFLRPWLWLAGAIALLLFLPNIVWQVRHGYPTLEDLENVRRLGKNVVLSPPAFIAEQVLVMHPLLLPVWLGGLIYLLRQRQWRLLGWAFVAFFAVMMLLKAKSYYLFPIYPMLLAGGAVALEAWAERRRAAGFSLWPRNAALVLVVIGGLLTVPVAVPLFSPERYLAYARALHAVPPKSEVAHAGPLPQLLGDQFGWEELVREVADIHRSLPPEERARTGIYAGNYGEAGAINLFGPQYGLPPAVSAHQNHFFWGPPQQPYENLIVIQWDREDVEESCTSWEEPVVHYHPWGMAEENRPIYLCRGLKFDLKKAWPRLKHWN